MTEEDRRMARGYLRACLRAKMHPSRSRLARLTGLEGSALQALIVEWCEEYERDRKREPRGIPLCRAVVKERRG